MPTPISRRYRVQEKRSTRRGITYIVLAIILFVVFINFGIPLAGQLAGYIGNSKRSLVDENIGKNVTPLAPQLDNLQQFSSEESITLTGRAESGSTLKVYRNDNVVKDTLIDESGTYSLSINLINGENKIWTTSTNKNNTEGGKSKEYTVIFDDTPPVVEINKPTENETIYGPTNKSFTVEGKTEKDNKVTINERIAIVSDNGNFSAKISLSEGLNEITIIVTDQAQNMTEKKITITYSP